MTDEQIVDTGIRSDAASYRLFNKYRSLEPGEIRLLSILPKFAKGVPNALHSDDGVECNVIYSRLDSDVRYEALSYCWGNSKPTAEIVIVNHNDHRFQVTDSLLAALRQFRLRDTNRLVWLDFICINQDDQVEKAHQVSRMTDIYRKADRVLGWLGPADRAGESMYLLNQSRLGVKEVPAELNMVWMSDMSVFLSKPFFSRIWIIQEVAVARQLSLCFGQYQISWEDFRSLLDLILEQYGDVMNTTNTDTGLERIWMLLSTRNLVSEHIAKDQPRSLVFYAYQTSRMDANRSIPNVERNDHVKFVGSSRAFGSTDPRDRIFALSGLMPDQFRDVSPDYDRRNTTCKVFYDFAVRTLSRMQNLEILSQAGIHEGDLPSWVPDYTRRLAHHPLDLDQYRANAEVFEYRKPPSANALLVTGYRLGTIQELEPGFSNTKDKFDNSALTTRWRPARSLPPEQIEIFERTLTNTMSIVNPIFTVGNLKDSGTPTDYINFGKALISSASALVDAVKHRTPRISPELERTWYAAAVKSSDGIDVENLQIMYFEFLLGGSALPGLSLELSAKYTNLILGIWRENIKANPWQTRGWFGDGNEIPSEIKVAYLEANGPPTKDAGVLHRAQAESTPSAYWIGDDISDAVKKAKQFITGYNGDSNTGNQKQLSEMERKIADYEKRPKAVRRQDDQDIKKILARMFNREVERMSQGRKLAVTDKALGIAWVPQLAQTADQIWILTGARVPFVLRPVPKASGVYRVIGEAYHRGAMYGEYFSGENRQGYGTSGGNFGPSQKREDLILI